MEGLELTPLGGGPLPPGRKHDPNESPDRDFPVLGSLSGHRKRGW